MRTSARARLVLLGVVLAVTLAAGALIASAGGAAPERAAAGADGAASSCAFVVRWKGRTYEAHAVQVSPRRGRLVGTGTSPSCTYPGDDAPAEPPERVRLAAIPGVRPRNAVGPPSSTALVFVRRGLDRLPPEVEALTRAPRCESEGRVRLAGRWLGLKGRRGQSGEGDPQPPYDLAIHVRRASKARYRRAFLDVRVPRTLGRPITQKDVETSLWEGGTLEATVRCGKRGRYIAVEVEAHPPS